ncbi:MAG: hypothetical protein CMP48_17810 [Rickettsiales bacterium]|nr:hypothetical protein [Rickettsiales bacterium]
MGRVEFINQLKALGYSAHELSHNVIAIEYEVPIGINRGKRTLLGFPVGNDFPMNCPAGLHFNSNEDDWKEPRQNVTDSPLGAGWRYWSRRFPDWNRTDKSVKTFMSHVRNILTRI